jgi:hypothetical protein
LRESVLYLATGETLHPVTPIAPDSPSGARGERWRELRSPRSGTDFLRLISTRGGDR